MLVVMEMHRLVVNVRLQRVVGVGQRGKHEWHRGLSSLYWAGGKAPHGRPAAPADVVKVPKTPRRWPGLSRSRSGVEEPFIGKSGFQPLNRRRVSRFAQRVQRQHDGAHDGLGRVPHDLGGRHQALHARADLLLEQT